jgi:hypothetical protein
VHAQALRRHERGLRLHRLTRADGGVESSANRLFALDIAGAYSFAHLTSSAGLVSWIHVVSVYVGPRLSF